METHCIGARRYPPTKWYGYRCATCECYEQIFPRLVTSCGRVSMNQSQPWSCSCWFSNTKRKTQSKNNASHAQHDVKGVICKLRYMLKESVTLLKRFWQHWLAMSEWKLTLSIATQTQCSQPRQGRVGWGLGISFFLQLQCRHFQFDSLNICVFPWLHGERLCYLSHHSLSAVITTHRKHICDYICLP